ncbi:hypothetical protein AB0C96_04440 [Streptomyces sp. NPDC048506]
MTQKLNRHGITVRAARNSALAALGLPTTVTMLPTVKVRQGKQE